MKHYIISGVHGYVFSFSLAYVIMYSKKKGKSLKKNRDELYRPFLLKKIGKEKKHENGNRSGRMFCK